LTISPSRTSSSMNLTRGGVLCRSSAEPPNLLAMLKVWMGCRLAGSNRRFRCYRRPGAGIRSRSGSFRAPHPNIRHQPKRAITKYGPKRTPHSRSHDSCCGRVRGAWHPSAQNTAGACIIKSNDTRAYALRQAGSQLLRLDINCRGRRVGSMSLDPREVAQVGGHQDWSCNPGCRPHKEAGWQSSPTR
jgi:hypothetical protein